MAGEYEQLHERAREWQPGRTRAVLLALVRSLVRLLFAPEITGEGRVPASGPLLLTANHRSLSDGIFQAAAFPRPLRWMGMAELFEKRASGRLVLALGAFPVRRGAGDERAIETARVLLERGQAVAIYPEGKLQFRSAELVGEPHSGAGRLALETGAQLLPMAMVGTDRLLAASLRRGKHRIRISYGTPIAAAPETRRGFLAGDREAAARLVRETLWPSVRSQVQVLRERPSIAAAGGGGTLLLGAGLYLWLRRRRSASARLPEDSTEHTSPPARGSRRGAFPCE